MLLLRAARSQLRTALFGRFSSSSASDVPSSAAAEEQTDLGAVDELDETGESATQKLRLPYSQGALQTLKLDTYPFYVEREWWKHGNRMTFWAHWRMKKDVIRRETLAQYGPERMRLKALKFNTVLPQALRDECAERLTNGVPRYSHPSLILNMCTFTGRRRGKIKPFRVNRHIFRRLADHGELSGVQRGMW